MARDMLRVDGISDETLRQLQASALRLYGKPNASLLVRALITEHLAKGGRPETPKLNASRLEAEPSKRVEIRMPARLVDQLSEMAETRLSARNYYITSILLGYVGQPQLQGDEIEVLRRSNYELAKIGTNLNQIARAFNTLVKTGGDGKVPEVGKKLSSLRNEITEHTRKVLRVLKAGTPVWETMGKGRGQRVKRK